METPEKPQGDGDEREQVGTGEERTGEASYATQKGHERGAPTPHDGPVADEEDPKEIDPEDP